MKMPMNMNMNMNMKRRTAPPHGRSSLLASINPLLVLVVLWVAASPSSVVLCFSSSSSTMRTSTTVSSSFSVLYNSKDHSISMTPSSSSSLLLRHHQHHRRTPTESRRRKNNNPRGVITGATSTSSSTSLSNSLIPYNDEWGNLAVLAGTSVIAQILGTRTRIGKLLGSPVSAMAITFALASIGILCPGGTITARRLQLLSISFATPWILLGANFGTSSSDGSDTGTATSNSNTTLPLIIGFMIASIGTILGCIIGWLLTGDVLMSTLSVFGLNDGLKIASALLAKNIGGGINYIAVCSALQASPEAIATGLCIDNFAALIYFPICNLIANQYNDPNDIEYDIEYDNEYNSDTDTGTTSSSVSTTGGSNNNSIMTVESISIAFFAACGLLWMGDLISTNVLNSPSSQIPVVTLLSVIVASGILSKINILKIKQPINYMINKISARSGSDGSGWLSSILGNDNATNKNEDKHNDKVELVNMNQLRTTCDTLGTVCLYLFFATAGAPGMRVAKSMKSALLPLSLFSMCLYTIHGMVLYSSYKLFGIQQPQKKQNQGKRYGFEFRRQKKKQQRRWNSSASKSSSSRSSSSSSSSSSWRDAFSPQRLLIASSSAIGGPATSVALARSVKWESLIVPALLVGNIGYAIATFIGIGFYYCFAAAL